MESCSTSLFPVAENGMEDHAVRMTATLMIIIAAMGASIVLGISTIGGKNDRLEYVLISTINPNKASKARILCLPGIGPARAQAILQYRRSFRYSEQAQAFQDANDLTHLSGMGTVIVDRMRPWLSFTDP
jgi:competence protein ComEA